MKDFRRRQYKPVRIAVRDARNGDQERAAATLRGFVDGDDPYLAWAGCAAWLTWAWWTGQTGPGSDAAERTVLRFGGRSEELGLAPEVPFMQAVAAGAMYDGRDRNPRLLRMAAALPPGSELAADLREAAAQPDPMWGIPQNLMPPTPSELLDSLSGDPRSWPADRLELIWSRAAFHGRRDVLEAMFDAGLPVPPTPDAQWRVAQALLEAGRVDEGATLVAATRRTWQPYYWWQTLPSTPALHPRLRPLLTPAVRHEFFTEPIGGRTWS
jgi:hypothetical protein